MSGINRLHQLALGGWLLAASPFLYVSESLPQEQPSDSPAAQESAEQHKSPPAPNQEMPIKAIPAPDPIDTASADPSDAQDAAQDTEAEDQRAKADLDAQQEMARWAFWMIVVSAASVVIAGVAVLLVYLTLREARKTTKVVEATLAETREGSERQLRAYVTIEAIQARPHNNPMTYQLVWKNTGQTPAANVLTYTNWESRMDALPDNFSYPRGSINDATVLGPGQSVHAWPIFIPGETVERIRRNILQLYVWGAAEYSDYFKDTPRRRTEFCYKIVFDDAAAGDGQITMGSSIYGPHNGIDDDCYRQREPM